MPTYDYECQECMHRLEAFHAMSAPPLTECPACGKPALKRKIGTGAGLIFKGSGFYQTDYRSDGYKKSAEAESGKSKPASEPKKEAKTESKTESKPTTTGKDA
ncbi:MAG: FmdB family zinc ribbon protein [Kiritimatiellia bacterium]